MQLLLRDAMQSSIILLLFAASASALYEKADDSDSSTTIKIKHGVLQINITNDRIIILNLKKNDGENMTNILYTKSPQDVLQSPFKINNCGRFKVCITSGSVTHTVIQGGHTSDLINITRLIPNPDAEIMDCYQLAEGTQWFGGPQLRYQDWPIQDMYYREEPYLPMNTMSMAVAERYWLSGKGVYLYVNENVPLFLDQNRLKAKHICLIAKNKAPYRQRDQIELNYKLGVVPNPKLAHQRVVRNLLGKPKSHPDERMIQHPIWSTWARYKTNVNEKVVETFADEIIANNFENSQIEIDDNWETCYGSAVFDPVKFPNIPDLMQRLKDKGFRVTLWTHPFINKGCEPAYSTALKNSYFVQNLNGSVHMQWWQGQDAATIDFTNPKAVSWWVDRLKLLEKDGIDSFKFDAGEVSWLPQVAKLNSSIDMQPGIFTQDYLKTLSNNFNKIIEVRAAWRNQELPIFVRMMDKDTRWVWNNGLPTLITTLLQMNLNGYVYVLPDMIGGNGYFWDGPPTKELFIRWLQANVFMPALQYSYVPWDFDNETIAICKRYTKLHADQTPVILKAMQQAIADGTPVNPPIWWVDPTNTEAQKINDEYLLGESILVAPVVVKGAVTRDIYLPAGRWFDPNRNTTHVGPMWLKNYSAPLDTLPYFMKV